MIERGGTGGGSSADRARTAMPRIERVPPNSEQAEMAVLGSVLLDGDVIGTLIPIIEPSDFYRSAHGRLYEIMRDLYDRGEPIDALLVFRELERQGAFDEVGGADYLATLDEAVASPANAEHYARIVREKAIARSLISATTEIQQAAYAEEGRGDELLELAEASIFDLGNRRDVQGAKNVKSLLNETFEELERGEGPMAGIETGFYQFDEMTTGLRPGELIIIAARPSMGKTSLALNVAMNAAVAGKKNVAIYSLEMTAQNIVRNMLCAKARFSGHDLRKGRFIDDSRRADLAQAAGPLFEAGIFIDDTPTLNPSLLRAKARRIKAKHGLDMILIDYLQLMEAGTSRRSIDNRQQEISYISRSLKGLARELEVPVIALSQLNRDAEKRPDNRPKLADLRESGAIEQDADVICLLFRKWYYSRQDTDKNQAELMIAKQRNGPTGTVNLHFFADYMLFTNPALHTM
ncbi:MAG: replicative DNA helicase [Planctomycetota bacterium]|nr:replicative DNA helicase [Planctomycetota bacterium]